MITFPMWQHVLPPVCLLVGGAVALAGVLIGYGISVARRKQEAVARERLAAAIVKANFKQGRN